MFKISVKKEFSAAHKLIGYPGVCRKIHGHNWKVQVNVATGSVDELGMGIDFKVIDDLLDEVIARLDHQFLNEVAPFDKKNQTDENLAGHFNESIQDKIADSVRVASVDIAESDNYVVTFEP